MPDPDTTPSTTRRALLASAASVGVGASAGCLKQIRNVAGRNRPQQLSLEIKTVPADSDPYAIRIARHLEANLTAAGVDVMITPMASEELYRQVLLNHTFDIYVGQYPDSSQINPDALYPFLHSRFGSETGWQNPFGFADIDIDGLLEEQRKLAEQNRRNVVDELQVSIARRQPFVTVAFPDSLSAVREDRYIGWDRSRPTDPLALLALERAGGGEPMDPLEGDADGNDSENETAEPSTETPEGEEGQDPNELRLAMTDERITHNLNPIAAEYRHHGTFVDLLYDSPAREIGGEVVPWAAHSWEWLEESGETPVARVQLRRDLKWHDGTPLTAEDVAFTYRFLADTSLGRADSPIPTTRYRGRSTLVEDAAPQDDRTVDVRFVESSHEVARRALTVPLLPEHIWSEQTGPASIAGIEVNDNATEALVWSNPEPVGSGPIRFAEATPGEEIRFERYDDHFLGREAPSGTPEPYLGKPAFDSLLVTLSPSDVAAAELVIEDFVDGTVSNLGANAIPHIARSTSTRLISNQSNAFYHVGFNTRQAPLSNPRFRVLLARLIDKERVVDEAFDDYATPAAGPLAVGRWHNSELDWDGEDPVAPFFEGPDGQLDVEAVRDAFREEGYRYNDDGELLVG